MSRPTLTALTENTDEGVRVLAPKPGFLIHHRPVGDLLRAGDLIGRLEILSRQYDLLLPGQVSGVVREAHLPDAEVPVQFRQPLCEIGKLETGDRAAGDDANTSGGEATKGYEVTAPSHGIFYRRPDPDSPAYVEVGQVVKPGTVLGLVEVMKCFNQIRLEGTEAKLLEVRVDDSQEVEGGQVLFVFER